MEAHVLESWRVEILHSTMTAVFTVKEVLSIFATFPPAIPKVGSVIIAKPGLDQGNPPSGGFGEWVKNNTADGLPRNGAHLLGILFQLQCIAKAGRNFVFIK